MQYIPALLTFLPATKSTNSVSYGKRVVITCDDGYKIKEYQEIVVTCQVSQLTASYL